VKPAVFGYTYYGKPYVIGEAPGPRPGAPLEAARRRIARLIREDEAELAELFEWMNLLDEWPGYGPGGGSAFPVEAARRRARMHMINTRPAGVTRNRPFVYLGKRVAAAFDFRGEWFEWHNDQVVTPHPSGLSRWWNDRANEARARQFWTELAMLVRISGRA